VRDDAADLRLKSALVGSNPRWLSGRVCYSPYAFAIFTDEFQVPVRSEGNHIYFDTKVQGDPLSGTAALYNLVRKQGYQDIVLDFRQTRFLSAEFMLPFVTICRSYRQDKVDFEFIMPEDRSTANLLINTNWAHLVSPENFDQKGDKNINHLSARQYFTAEEHFSAVDDSISVILNSVEGIDRSRLKALEWALNEITDNVLNHAESPVGGVMQVITFPKRRRIEFFENGGGKLDHGSGGIVLLRAA